MVQFDIPDKLANSITVAMTPFEFIEVQAAATAPYIAQITELTDQNRQNAALITDLKMQLADALKQTASKVELLESANDYAARLERDNTRLQKALQDANVAIPIPPDVPVVVPVVVPDEPKPEPIIGTLPGFATYLVDSMGNSDRRNVIMTGHIDKLHAAGITEIVMLCNDGEIDDGTIPEYIESKNMDWWADTFYAVYKVQMGKLARDKAANIPLNKIPDYFGNTVKRCETFKAHRGYVLDDVHSISPAEFEVVVIAIRKHSSKPIVASFGILSDITAYLPTITKYKVLVARQLYRHDKADEITKPSEDTPEERTAIITTWLTKAGLVCDVGNLEYYKEGDQITRADDLRHMYNRCIDAGLKSFHGYAAVDSTGFKIWQHADLWQAFQECAAAYPNKVKIA